MFLKVASISVLDRNVSFDGAKGFRGRFYICNLPRLAVLMDLFTIVIKFSVPLLTVSHIHTLSDTSATENFLKTLRQKVSTFWHNKFKSNQ